MDDADLVRATRSGDLAAFTTIFDRHAARVHDLALAMLRDRTLALEIVEATFLEASLRLQALEEEYRLGVWILAVTRRNAALRAGPTAGVDRQPSLPNDDPQRVQLAGLVWEAVADLPLRDRTLIDLELRQGLDGLDLADAMGVTITQVHDLQGRMRDRIEKGVSAHLVARTADGRCPGLAKVLKGWDTKFAPRSSRRIVDHVEGCGVCTQARFALPAPFSLYAAALPAPFPAAVRSRVIDRVVLPAPSARPGAGVPVPASTFGEPTVATAAYQSPTAAPRGAAVGAFPEPAPFPGSAPEPAPFSALPATYAEPPTAPVQAQPQTPGPTSWPPAPAPSSLPPAPGPVPDPVDHPPTPYPVPPPTPVTYPTSLSSTPPDESAGVPTGAVGGPYPTSHLGPQPDAGIEPPATPPAEPEPAPYPATTHAEPPPSSHPEPETETAGHTASPGAAQAGPPSHPVPSPPGAPLATEPPPSQPDPEPPPATLAPSEETP